MSSSVAFLDFITAGEFGEIYHTLCNGVHTGGRQCACAFDLDKADAAGADGVNIFKVAQSGMRIPAACAASRMVALAGALTGIPLMVRLTVSIVNHSFHLPTPGQAWPVYVAEVPLQQWHRQHLRPGFKIRPQNS
jgi:hypothetical protein